MHRPYLVQFSRGLYQPNRQNSDSDQQIKEYQRFQRKKQACHYQEFQVRLILLCAFLINLQICGLKVKFLYIQENFRNDSNLLRTLPLSLPDILGHGPLSNAFLAALTATSTSAASASIHKQHLKIKIIVFSFNNHHICLQLNKFFAQCQDLLYQTVFLIKH